MGDVDQNWQDLVFRCFGQVDWHSFRRSPDHFHTCRDWLREPWQPQREIPNDKRKLKTRLPDDATEEEIEMYARVYMLDLFSSVIFSDQSGYIQTMWLQFMEDVHDPPKYSWGSAVLARLYRTLCDGSHKNKEQMGGPLMLLQMWVLIRFPISRPRKMTLPGHLPYGAKWMGTEHDYQDEPHRSITLYRHRYETLHPDDVNWWPYDENEENMALLAPICNLQEHQSWYFYKSPLICFWIVE